MTWTTPATPVTLTVITTTFYIVNIRDNLNHLRALTGSADPGAAGLSLESDTATSAAWVGGKVARAGDTMTSDLQINRSGSAAPTTGYLILGNNGAYYIGFDGTKHVISTPALHVQNDLYVYRIGAPSTGYLILGNNAANYIGFDGTNVVISGNKVWHEGNDGPTSGLAAQTAASATTATSASNAALLNNENWKTPTESVVTPARTVNTTPTSDVGLTIPATGHYLLMVKGRFNVTVGDTAPTTDIYQNGSQVASAIAAVENVAMPNVPAITWRVVACTAGDTIQARSYKTGGPGTTSIQGVLLTAAWFGP